MQNLNPIPNNEKDRLNALESYHIIDTLAEKEFDRLTELASIICGVPIALVSLIDTNRQWFKSRVGLDVSETPRNISFCQFAIMDTNIFEISDATTDERFKGNPLVTGAPDIRFYAGYPLIDSEGYVLGTLCVIDREAKKLSESQLKALELLGKEVVSQILARKNKNELEEYSQLFNTTSDMVCLSGSDGYLKKVNPAFSSILGWSESELLEHPYLSFVHPDDQLTTINETEKLKKGSGSFSFVNRLKTKVGDYRTVQWSANPSKISTYSYAIARDITEIKKNEEDLIFNLNKVNNLKNALNESAIVVRIDENFKITYVNDKFCELSKYTRAELIGNDYFILNNDLYTNDFIEKLKKTIFDGVVYKSELKYLNKEGELFWLNTTIVPFAKSGQKPNQFISISSNISALKSKEIEIQKLLDYQNSILNGTDYAIISTDINGIIVNFNKGAQDLLGYTEEDLVGKNSPAIFHDEAEVVNQAKLLSAEFKTDIAPGFDVFVYKARLGKPDVNEWTYIRKDNSRCLVTLAVTALYNNQKKIYGYLGIARDITETKKNQELLKFTEERHRLFFENSQGLLCTHDRNGKFLTMNTAGANLIGYTSNELLQMSLFDVTPDSAKKRVQRYLNNVFYNGKDEGLMQVVHKNGTKKVWFYKNVLVKEANGDLIAIGNAIDISERIENEKELVAAKMLAEKSVLAKDQFLANMSHEIRTPMNAILGFTDILLSTNLDSQQREYLSAISNSGENLMVIINDILDFSKIESGNLKIEKIPISIRNICNDVKKILVQSALERNILFQFYIDSDLPNVVLTDGVRLNQMLINLLGNAIKFTENGKVELYCKIASKTEDVCHIQFIIIDTGIGIPVDKQDQIFERFKQADDGTTRKFGGTGLGLSITKKLIELFGGTIKLKSTEGEGSEFCVDIPFEISKEADVVFSESQLIETSNRSFNILLTEDNILNQRLAVHILNTNNMKVTIASNGQEAIDILKTNSFDIILMDLQMPVMDGYEATKIIRSVLNIKTPIIAMTAHSLVGEKEKCIEIGMDEYISKPYKAKELIDKIKKQNMSESGNPVEKNANNNSNLKYDLSDLYELSGDNKAFVLEMLNIFVKEVPIEISKLSASYTEGDFQNVKKIAHKIKSTFMLFKIDENVSLCSKLELSSDLTANESDVELLKLNAAKAVEMLTDDFLK